MRDSGWFAHGRRLFRLVDEDVRALLPAIRWVGTFLLVVWFAWQTYDRVTFFTNQGFPVGIDATIYYRGVVAWLDGGDPWDAAVVVNGWSFHYAGSPVTTVLMAPAALVSEVTFTRIWVLATWASAVWTLRRLNLPLWWLLFPPIGEALFSANPQIVVLALLVANHPLASAVATGLKVYAFIPLVGEGRWRHAWAGVGLVGATAVIASDLWIDYIGKLGFISRRLMDESTKGGSAFYYPELLAVTVLALVLLALRDRRTAGWLAVPAVWPASQFHYSTMALPVMSPFLAVFLALPATHAAPIAIVLEAGRRLIQPLVMRLVASLAGPPETVDVGDDAMPAPKMTGPDRPAEYHPRHDRE
ncbi:MAG TPA: glycosyltransferase family 87 protein [Candidatus Limnocylindrales bacterium]|nr:glycosyltransferase family 87 protein [Candidatus Limnocylindrales bacterium]